jgi:RimJ/RimL family protein N-acetyltransferase
MSLAALPQPLALRLRSGEAIAVRALVPEDRALVADAFERLSERSRFLRFFSPMPRLPERTLDFLLGVDHCDHVALIALHDGRAAAVARFVRDHDDRATADLAITVVDAYQGRGLGRALVGALCDAAAARGVRRLTMDVHPDNRVMQALARSLGVRLAFRDGALHGVLDTARRPGLADAA